MVGLGNPERQYRDNRHNFGFRVLDAIGEKLKVDWQRKFDGELGQGKIGDRRVMVQKPLTFMNRSGDSVGPAVRFYKVPLSQLLVVHDELDLPLGRLQLRQGGGHGGHNGLRSIEAALGSKDFGRLRLGIGRPPAGWDPADHVLSDFRQEEVAAVADAVTAAVTAVEAVLTVGFAKAMNEHNRREKP